jgi:hypothetical protein
MNLNLNRLVNKDIFEVLFNCVSFNLLAKKIGCAEEDQFGIIVYIS